MSLSREDILAADDKTTATVDVPEWGGSVIVKTLTGLERDRFEASMMGRNNQLDQAKVVGMKARLLALCIVDEDGRTIFEDADVDALGAKSAAALNRIFSVAADLNGLTDDDVEALEKN